MKNLNEQLEEELKEPGFMGVLKSQNWALGVFFFLITPLMFHTGNLILEVSGFDFEEPFFEYVYSGFFALGFDLAILTFAANQRKAAAGWMAFFVILLNFSFFNFDFLSTLGGFFEEADQSKKNSNDLGYYPYSRIGITLLISALGGWIVHSYVSFFIEKSEDRKKLFAWMKRATGAEEMVTKLKDSLKNSTEKLTASEHEVGIQRDIAVNCQTRTKKIIKALRDKSRDNATLREKVNQLQMKLDSVTAKEILKASNGSSSSSNGSSHQMIKPFSECGFCEREFKSQQQENAVRGRCERCKERKANKTGEFAETN